MHRVSPGHLYAPCQSRTPLCIVSIQDTFMRRVCPGHFYASCQSRTLLCIVSIQDTFMHRVNPGHLYASCQSRTPLCAVSNQDTFMRRVKPGHLYAPCQSRTPSCTVSIQDRSDLSCKHRTMSMPVQVSLGMLHSPRTPLVCHVSSGELLSVASVHGDFNVPCHSRTMLMPGQDNVDDFRLTSTWPFPTPWNCPLKCF